MPVWKTFRHNGVAFPDPYVARGLSVTIKGVQVNLTPLAEEMAYNLAKKKDTPYVQDPVFVANFMKYFLEQLPPGNAGATFQDVDFSQLYRLLDQERLAKEAVSKEERKT